MLLGKESGGRRPSGGDSLSGRGVWATSSAAPTRTAASESRPSSMLTSIPQAIDDYSPYVDKQSKYYINDINGGVYTNNSLSLVTFDLGQIYNSSTFTDTNDLTLAIPVTMVAGFANANATLTPTANNSAVALLALKNNFINLIHQGDLVVQGKTIESTQPFINVARNFQMLSEMSINDLRQLEPS